MCNQDNVALQLIRTPIMEMHELMHERGRPAWRWSILLRDPRTHEFLLSHGWVFADYIDECVLLHEAHEMSYISQVMCRDFIAGIKDYQ